MSRIKAKGICMHLQAIRQHKHDISRDLKCPFWRAKHMGHALVTAAIMEAAMKMTAKDTLRLLADHKRA